MLPGAPRAPLLLGSLSLLSAEPMPPSTSILSPHLVEPSWKITCAVKATIFDIDNLVRIKLLCCLHFSPIWKEGCPFGLPSAKWVMFKDGREGRNLCFPAPSMAGCHGRSFPIITGVREETGPHPESGGYFPP